MIIILLHEHEIFFEKTWGKIASRSTAIVLINKKAAALMMNEAALRLQWVRAQTTLRRRFP
ncbi:hypothetical protein [Porphyromonas pogonae]|uniref:hypothetical protein n=1 Tax=Porphyromonas pogonae TaxID=867595 RepID=UPI002E761880|nr:hypothetical protein [Porphyromonas pogonae]